MKSVDPAWREATCSEPRAFKGVEFDSFIHEAVLNAFTLSPQKWISATNSSGAISSASPKTLQNFKPAETLCVKSA